MREHIVTVALSAEELAVFEAVAKRHGLPVEAMLRHLVRREAHWTERPESFAHAMLQGQRRDVIDEARKRLGTEADL